MDVPQSDYWHVSLKGFRPKVMNTMKIFPPLTTTQNEGILYKNVRAYHQGGPVLINGKRADKTCLECEFPYNLPTVEHYLPIGSLGFGFWRFFSRESNARSFRNTMAWATQLSDLEVHSNYKHVTDKFGRHYTSDLPLNHRVSGIIADINISKMVDFYKDLAEGDFSCGELGALKFSMSPDYFQIERAFDF